MRIDDIRIKRPGIGVIITGFQRPRHDEEGRRQRPSSQNQEAAVTSRLDPASKFLASASPRRSRSGSPFFLPAQVGNTCRRLDLEMRDLEARQVRRYAPVGPAVVVTPNDAEVRGDVQLFLRVVADDIVDRQVAVVGRRRECRRAAFDVKVRERTRARGWTAFAHVEDVTRSGGRRCIVARIGDPGTVHVVGIRINRAWESRGRSGRIVDPVPGDSRRIDRICIVRHEDAAGRRRCPERSMVGLVPRDPGDRSTRDRSSARQVTRIVRAIGPPSGWKSPQPGWPPNTVNSGQFAS